MPTPPLETPLLYADGVAPWVVPPVDHYWLDPFQPAAQCDATHTLLVLELGCAEVGGERWLG